MLLNKMHFVLNCSKYLCCKIPSCLNVNGICNKYKVHPCKPILYSSFITSVPNPINKDDPIERTGEKFKVKKAPVQKVTLLGPDDNILTVATVEEVQKIAEKRDLRLIKIVDLDNKSQRPIYKMMTDAQYLEEDYRIKKEKKSKKEKHVIKGEKLLLFSERISEHDLEMRMKKCIKWLANKYEVRIIISCVTPNKSLAESVFTTIENVMNGGVGRIVQKRITDQDLRFNILPPKEVADPLNVSDEGDEGIQ